MTTQTLLLSPWYTPHKVIHWQTAICMLFLGKCEVVDEYEETIASPSITMRMPAVVRLKKNIGSIKRGVKFSKLNILTRDGYRCQYCGIKGGPSTLNYDHVLPRSQGGKTIWENIVSSCFPCNEKKSNRTPEQAGMRLLSKPVKPKTLPMTAPQIKDVHPTWSHWLKAS